MLWPNSYEKYCNDDGSVNHGALFVDQQFRLIHDCLQRNQKDMRDQNDRITALEKRVKELEEK